jgi:hypothetical protein
MFSSPAAPAIWARGSARRSRFPSTRADAPRLGLVTIDEMVGALARAVENPCVGVRVVEVPGIRERLR